MSTTATQQNGADLIENWDAGQPCWTVEMGGLGPGYEQVIQIAMVELVRDNLGKPLPEPESDEADSWGDETLHKHRGSRLCPCHPAKRFLITPPRGPFPGVMDLRKEYIVGDVLRKACDVEMVGHMPRFYLTASVGKVGQRIVLALLADAARSSEEREA